MNDSLVNQLLRRVERLEMRDPRNSTRYPYTYACDYLRERFGVDSRSSASQKMSEIAALLEQRDHELVAVAFAEAFLARRGGQHV